jgi:cysteine desulfurase
VARILNVNPGEIFFTSGGTESANTAINAAVKELGCRHIITSPLEHHATSHSIENMVHEGHATMSLTKLTDKGHIDLHHLEELLAGSEQRSLVCLMHANNEIGNLLKIKSVGELCQKYDALFYCDTVQTVGHYPMDLKHIPVHFISAAAHKFHGPKGVGILYINENIRIKPFIQGGAQERNQRAGTENIYGIVGLAKALEIATERHEQDAAYIRSLKQYMANSLTEHFPGVRFNGDMEGSSLYTVLNASFPMTEKSEMLLYSLDMAGICVSGGSACTSGANSVSHVIRALYGEAASSMVPIRFSFCRHNTRDEVDRVIQVLKEHL